MVDKFGSDQQQLANSGGSVISQDNAVLINGDSDGSTALLFGPAAIREIQAGVANGDFAIPPSDSEGSITDDNDLPYFTATDSGNGRITATIADATLAAGQNVLRFTMTNAIAGDEFFVERFVSIPTSEARTFGNQPRFAVSAATSSANYRLYLETQYYKQDATTATGTGTSGVVTGAAIATSLAALSSAAVEYQQNPNGTGSAPEDAAFLFLKVGVKVTGAVASATLDLSEIRIDRSTIQYLLSDQVLPDLFGPASLYLYSGNLVLVNGGIVGSEPKMILGAASGDISLDATGQGDTITLTSANRTGSTVTIVTTRAHVFATGYEVVVAGITGTAGATMNGTYIVTVTNSTTFTYTSAGTAGAGTVTSATVKSGPGSGIIYLKPAATAAGRVQVDGDLVIDGANSEYVARVSHTATQSLTNNTSTKAVLSTASSTPSIETYDPNGWFNNANDSIDIGQDGFYCVTANAAFAANTTGRREVAIVVNGTNRGSINVSAASAGTTNLSVSTNLYLVVGDQVTVTLVQTSGGALNTANVAGVFPALSVGRIGA
jgi:hypothetical protein